MQKKTKIKLLYWEIHILVELVKTNLQAINNIQQAALLSVILDFLSKVTYNKSPFKNAYTVSVPYPVALCFYAFYNGRKIDNEEVYLLINKILAEIDKTIDSQIRLKSFEISEVV